MLPTIIEAQSDSEFVQRGVALLSDEIQRSISDHGNCIIGLSGGSTPKAIYEALGKVSEVDWSKVWLFLVDDRYVRADDPNSNQFLLRSTLLKNAPIPESQILFPDTTLPLEKCIDLYGKHLKDLLKKRPADLVTLGLGDDGHTASLFPPLSDDASGPKLVIHTTTEKFAVKDRISVTLPVLERAWHTIFFLKGDAKKKVWSDMTAGTEGMKRWPGKAVLNDTPTTVIALW